MPEQWLTYRQLGELWNTTPEAARLRSRRANYQRRTNEQGTAEVLVETDETAGPTGADAPQATERTADLPYTAALASISETQSQVSYLLQELAKAEAQVELLRRHLDAERQQVSQLMTALLRRGGEQRRRGWFFWRRTDKRTIPEASLLAGRPNSLGAGPDAPRFSPVGGPDTAPASPVNTAATPDSTGKDSESDS